MARSSQRSRPHPHRQRPRAFSRGPRGVAGGPWGHPTVEHEHRGERHRQGDEAAALRGRADRCDAEARSLLDGVALWAPQARKAAGWRYAPAAFIVALGELDPVHRPLALGAKLGVVDLEQQLSTSHPAALLEV